jgi:hypothetical protein
MIPSQTYLSQLGAIDAAHYSLCGTKERRQCYDAELYEQGLRLEPYQHDD